MFINEISAIIGRRPTYNDKGSNGTRTRTWYNVTPQHVSEVVAFLLEQKMYKLYPGDGTVRCNLRINYNGNELRVLMPDGAKQKNVDAQKAPDPFIIVTPKPELTEWEKEFCAMNHPTRLHACKVWRNKYNTGLAESLDAVMRLINSGDLTIEGWTPPAGEI